MFVQQMLSSALDEIDLTPLIHDRIDLNSIVELIDVDAVLTRIDVVPAPSETRSMTLSRVLIWIPWCAGSTSTLSCRAARS
jgi:hypothetical protein